MKRTIIVSALAVILTLLFTSCDVHFGDVHYDVHRWVIAIPVVIIDAIIIVTAHINLVRKRYRCLMCRTEFRPKWYEISSWLHDGERRVVKCPHCGRRGFCPPADDV